MLVTSHLGLLHALVVLLKDDVLIGRLVTQDLDFILQNLDTLLHLSQILRAACNLRHVLVTHVLDVLVERLERVEAELSLLLLLQQVQDEQFFDLQLLDGLFSLSHGLRSGSRHLLTDGTKEDNLNLELAFLLLHLGHLTLERLDLVLFATSLQLGLVAVETALDQLTDKDVLLVEETLGLLFELLALLIESQLLLLHALQLVLELLSLILDFLELLRQLPLLLEHIVVLLVETVLGLVQTPLLTLQRLNLDLEHVVVLVVARLLVLQILDLVLVVAQVLHILTMVRLQLRLGSLAGFHQLYVAHSAFVLHLSLVHKLAAHLVEVAILDIKMLDGLAQVGVTLLDTHGLVLLSQVDVLLFLELLPLLLLGRHQLFDLLA